VVVTTANFAAKAGTLARYERDDASDSWRRIGEEIPVVVGRSGMGWGRGLHPAQSGGPSKREGDGRAPAGVFRLSGTFGYAESAPGRLPYTPLTDTVECVDDPRSKRYNVIVDTSGITNPDWSSFEKMRRDDDLYRLGVVVDHNAFPATAGAGSCVFLHVWRGPQDGTAGCTAMDAEAMAQVAGWLDARARPVLVQLPAHEYDRLREAWRLPAR
jgi:D-alanyl-D-alanine dipeptidase